MLFTSPLGGHNVWSVYIFELSLTDSRISVLYCFHVHACTFKQLAHNLSRKNPWNKGGRVTGDSFTSALKSTRQQYWQNKTVLQFMHDCGNRMSGCLTAICVGCWLISFTSASHSSHPLLIRRFSSMMATAPDAACWRTHINAEVNRKAKKVKWFGRTGGISCGQIPRGYTGRKLDLEGTRAGRMMSFITADWWREVGYHSL